MFDWFRENIAGQIRFPKQIERSRVSVKSQANRVFPTKSNEHKYLAQAVLRILDVSERIDASFWTFNGLPLVHWQERLYTLQNGEPGELCVCCMNYGSCIWCAAFTSCMICIIWKLVSSDPQNAEFQASKCPRHPNYHPKYVVQTMEIFRGGGSL